ASYYPLNERLYHSRWDWLSLLYVPQAALGAVEFTALFSSFSAGLPSSARPRTVSFFDTLFDPPNELER
ncbi:hypothetical protein EV714DRAFT_254750, partial [Schizophyllum commune]